MNTITRHLGCEIEVEGISVDHDTLSYWSCTDEGSLRGDHTEFVLRRPMTSEFLQALVEVSPWLDRDDVRITNRCSLHIHVDVSDLLKEDIYKVCLLYTIFEPALYAISGNRFHNKFCMPVVQCRNVQTAIAGLCTGTHIYSEDRYCGLNLHALDKFGSLEFRMHKGTKDTKEIYEWALLLHNLVENGRNIEANDIVQSADRDILQLKDDVFGHLSHLVRLEGNMRRINYAIKVAEGIHLNRLTKFEGAY